MDHHLLVVWVGLGQLQVAQMSVGCITVKHTNTWANKREVSRTYEMPAFEDVVKRVHWRERRQSRSLQRLQRIKIRRSKVERAASAHGDRERLEAALVHERARVVRLCCTTRTCDRCRSH